MLEASTFRVQVPQRQLIDGGEPGGIGPTQIWSGRSRKAMAEDALIASWRRVFAASTDTMVG